MSSFSAFTPFTDLRDADLFLEHRYEGGSVGNIKDDPLAELFHRVGTQAGVGNQGGFRAAMARGHGPRLVVLYTTGEEPDWPDELDPYTGRFTYYGDNRSPGRELHATKRGGNRLLADAYEQSRSTPANREKVPPFLLFEKAGTGRDVRFRGLLAPGASDLSPEQELAAVWRTTAGHRFQNYRAHFTVLDEPHIPRRWIDDVLAGNPLGASCPSSWRVWVTSRTYTPLLAPPTAIVRSRTQQLPQATADLAILEVIHRHFHPRPTDFEQFAADMWRGSDAHVDKVDVTRPWRDGGRDAVGEFLIGPAEDPVAVEFALEAKCYSPSKGVGVKATSRLISRLRHRQFGVLFTTSYLDGQAYREIREDGHPVVILAGVDVVRLLKRQHLQTPSQVQAFLNQQYAPAGEPGT